MLIPELASSLVSNKHEDEEKVEFGLVKLLDELNKNILFQDESCTFMALSLGRVIKSEPR